MIATAADDAQPVPEDAKPARGRRKLILLAAPVLLALAGGGAWFSGVLPGPLGRHPARAGPPVAAPPVYIDLPEMVANLNGNPHHPSYVKLHAKLQVASAADAARVQAVMPRVLDLFQTYLREMRPDELSGSAGLYRLREELIARTSAAASPVAVQDVLFTEMLIQ